MKTAATAALILAAGLVVASAAEEKPAAVFKDAKDKLSYAIGVQIGNNLKRQAIDSNPDQLSAGIRDSQAGKALLTDLEVRDVIIASQTEARTKLSEKDRAFLAENAKKDGVKITASGLQYKVLASGDGPTPKITDTIKAHYRGTLIDGTEFDSSYTTGKPFTTPVSRVIAGWTEALQMMKVGDKWQLTIPGNLAYAERGYPPKIGPNATLIFEMELISIEAPNAGVPVNK